MIDDLESQSNRDGPIQSVGNGRVIARTNKERLPVRHTIRPLSSKDRLGEISCSNLGNGEKAFGFSQGCQPTIATV